MADAPSIVVANAVANELNAHSWILAPETFTAERLYYARFKNDDLKTMRVTVLALTHKDKHVTRERNQTDLTLWIDVQKWLDTDFASASALDGFVNFLDEIKGFYSDGHNLASPNEPWWVEDAEYFQGEFWSPQRLYQDHAYEAAIELTLRAHRNR